MRANKFEAAVIRAIRRMVMRAKTERHNEKPECGIDEAEISGVPAGR